MRLAVPCLLAILALASRAEMGDTSVAVADIEARLAYEAALRLAEDGDYDGAVNRLRWVSAEASSPEWAVRAEEKLAKFEALRDAPEPLSSETRAGLVGFGMGFATWLGVGSLILADADGEEMSVPLLVGPVVGLTYSLKATRTTRLSDGQASLVNLGGAWGVWQGTGAAVVAGASEDGVVAASMAGGLIGLGLSRAVVAGRPVTSGDAGLIAAAGAWGTWLTVCGTQVLDVDGTEAVVAAAMLGGDAALLTAAAAAGSANMSRARVRLINAGGMVGALYGWGATVLGEIDSGRGRWGAVGLGTVAGLAAGAYLTRGLDRSDSSDFFSPPPATTLGVTPRSVTYSVAF